MNCAQAMAWCHFIVNHMLVGFVLGAVNLLVHRLLLIVRVAD